MMETPFHQVGDRIAGHYEIHHILGGPGRSGMGIVYVVYDHDTRGVYALKTLQDRFLASPEAREAFRREALAWAHLERHPYIVRAYWVQQIGGRHFIALEYVSPNEQRRNCLTHYLTGQPLPVDLALRWAIQSCYGMEHVNSRGVVCHRDIKPDNIMITPDGTVKITDFGLAGVVERGWAVGEIPPGAEHGSQPCLSIMRIGEAVVCGTPGYIAPEVLRGAGADVRSDVYSFGVVLHQMATGDSIPFAARRSVDEVVAPPHVDTPLWPFIERCLAEKPEGRYANFEELRADLESILRERRGEVITPPDAGELEAAEWTNKACALDALGEHNYAIECCDRALALDPKELGALCNKAAALGALGRLDEALSCCDQALEIDPHLSIAWNSKGLALAGLGGRLEEALACYGQALEIDPGNALAWINKGLALEAMDRLEEALFCYDKGLGIDPKHSGAWRGRADVLAFLRRLEEAISCYDRALVLNPQDAEAWTSKSGVLAGLGRVEEALPCCDRALEIAPQDVHALCNKGLALRGLGRLEEALACFDGALALEPEDAQPVIWYNRAQTLEALGRMQEAAQAYRKLCALAPPQWGDILEKVRQRLQRLEGR